MHAPADVSDRKAHGDGALNALRPHRRMFAPLFHRLIDRLDTGFAAGVIEGALPDGTVRFIGGRGPGPVATLRITRWRALAQLLLGGSNGWFDAWMAGSWSSDDPVAVFAAFSANRRTLARLGRARGPLRLLGRARHALRRNSRTGARRNIGAHYDLGNDFYAAWLDPTLTYSSALFERADEPLEAAQLRKIGAILDRLMLQPGDRLLEIGCGWGALGRHATERYGAAYTGLTLSCEQAAHVRGLLGEDAVALRDYREQTGTFDAVASVEMVEAVGRAYWPDYLDAISRLLKPGGRAAIQYIAIDDAIFDAYAAGADFIQTHIFPGGCLLSQARFRAAAQARGFDWLDEHHFPLDYAETLARWRHDYQAALAQGRLPARLNAEFHRTWLYYLMYCEGGFRGGGITVAQVTLRKR